MGPTGTTTRAPHAASPAGARARTRLRSGLRLFVIGVGAFMFSLAVAVLTTEMTDRAEHFGRKSLNEAMTAERLERLQAQALEDARAARERGALSIADHQAALADARGRIAAYHRTLRDTYEQARQAPWMPLPPDPPRPRTRPGIHPDPGVAPGRIRGAGR